MVRDEDVKASTVEMAGSDTAEEATPSDTDQQVADALEHQSSTTEAVENGSGSAEELHGVPGKRPLKDPSSALEVGSDGHTRSAVSGPLHGGTEEMSHEKQEELAVTGSVRADDLQGHMLKLHHCFCQAVGPESDSILKPGLAGLVVMFVAVGVQVTPDKMDVALANEKFQERESFSWSDIKRLATSLGYAEDQDMPEGGNHLSSNTWDEQLMKYTETGVWWHCFQEGVFSPMVRPGEIPELDKRAQAFAAVRDIVVEDLPEVNSRLNQVWAEPKQC